MATESEIMSQEEVESPLQQDEGDQQKQPSIYSLTIDEFQNTLQHEGNKNFGSMNMDEFLNSIWTAEENQAATAAPTAAVPFNPEGTSTQPNSLKRQGSMTLPTPLCQKTVEEVWSEINRTEQNNDNSTGNIETPNYPQRQATFGEMTLEDFLVKAGVVRERGQLPVPPSVSVPAQPPPPPPQPFVPYHNTNNPVVAPCYITRPVMPGASVHGYPSVMASGTAYQRPMSPVSIDGPGSSQIDNPNQLGGIRGGPVAEKVVERRQRRMIKNRESAARARARKQAYTVELEAELNQLKEENALLKQALAELEKKRKQQNFDEVKVQKHTKGQKAKEKFKMIRRNKSCPY